ncbi:type II toxin-antitoxin system HipA family toxin [Cupriavidus agavae]|uniref:Serine/threonine-protein kinase HipA n=1 Tax=Cupriavidus agavae TaxID=1001822 RepID=A0A4V2FI41_9BURK|nr:HipA domain-containing protein [Cupriavidus agavae]RZT42459.1 serine/threonine-protein kinase HipA [Cupriavidus agavae]
MTSEVWVWAWLPRDTEPTLAGRFVHARLARDAGLPRFLGRFVYGRSYLANPDALALDPLHLRLADTTYETVALGGFFGALRDAMPDDWGRFVIDRMWGRQEDATGYLLNGNGDHIGNLGFSASREAPPERPVLPELDVLKPARQVLLGMALQREPDPVLRGLVQPNTNLGGARPKLTIMDGGKQWIAKFPAREDHGAPMARIENAMLKLARACGIDTAHARVVEDDILLVERFDRALVADGTGWRRDGFLSAQTVFHGNVEVQAYSFPGSYPRLAREMARFSEEPAADQRELFHRMVFNCCISNTDDHERNHGFLAADTPGFYALSPAYDMVPRHHATRRKEHALGIGQHGAVGTRENLLSDCEVFGLTRAQAREILERVEHTVQADWEQTLRDEGLDGAALDAWRPCFAPLPETL